MYSLITVLVCIFHVFDDRMLRKASGFSDDTEQPQNFFVFTDYNIIEASQHLTKKVKSDTADINGIKGLNVELQGPLFYTGPFDFIRFEGCKFDLYDSNGSLVDADRCSTDFFAEKDLEYFGNLDSKGLIFEMNLNDFSRPICPYLFKNARVRLLVLDYYQDDLLYHNTLKFFDILNPNNTSPNLNCEVDTITFQNLHRYRFVDDLINLKVFSNIKGLQITGILAHIEPDFFKKFDQLVYLRIFVYNAEEFFHSSTNEWLASMYSQGLQFGSHQELVDFLNFQPTNWFEFYFFQRINYYLYPDEDFCLFQHFPRFKLIFTRFSLQGLKISIYSDSRNTSCTYRYMAQNNRVLLHHMNEPDASVKDSASFDSDLLDECQFDLRLSICLNSSESLIRRPAAPTNVMYLDVLYVFGWLEFVGPVITLPIVSALAFVLNLLVILIVRSKKNREEKLFTSKTFQLIQLNSVFNCIECLIAILRMMGLCMGYNSVFCSSIRNNSFVYYFELVNIYISETMKSCSILTGLFFSIQRYIEASKTQNRFLKTFSGVGIGRLLSAVFAYGFITSVPVLFDIDFFYHNSNLNFYDAPERFYMRSEDRLKSMVIKTYFYFAHYVINDFAILIVNLIFDCQLVYVIKADLKQKSLNRQKHRVDNGMNDAELKKLNLEERKKKSVERKANAMIILSVLIYVFCRLPELTGIFITFYFHKLRKASCSQSIICFLIANFVEYMYLLSYVFNIFLYYKFSTYFHRGLRNFFGLEVK